MFVIVRHGHAGDKHRWRGHPEQRPLSPTGGREADAVAQQLIDLGVVRLLSSPTVRCRQTLQPAADRLGLTIEPAPALAIGGSMRDLLLLLADAGTDGAALCTHGEVINALDGAWQAGRAPTPTLVGGLLRGTPKGAGWVVHGYPGPDATATYVPPASSLSPQSPRGGGAQGVRRPSLGR